MKQKINDLFGNGYVKLTTVIIVVVALAEWGRAEITYRNELARRIEGLEHKLENISKQVSSNWSMQDMRIWSLETEKKNRELVLPDVHEVKSSK